MKPNDEKCDFIFHTHYLNAGFKAIAPRSALSTKPSAESKKCFVLMIETINRFSKRILRTKEN